MPDHLQHLITWHERCDDEWRQHIAAALRHYRHRHHRAEPQALRSLALIFFNPSLRTRTSMEVAGAQLGAHVTTLVPGSGTWGFEWRENQVMDGKAVEHVREAIGVLSRYYDALGVRIFSSGTDYVQDREETLMRTILRDATVPVINLESAFYHPCQALGDAATLHTHFDGDVRGKKFVLSWAYHPKALPMAVSHSALLMATRLGMRVTVARPEGFTLDPDVMRTAQGYAAGFGLGVEETHRQEAAIGGADVVYAKSWGGRQRYDDPSAEAAQRSSLRAWRISAPLMERSPKAVFMHCLPVRRGVVVDDEVLDGPQAIHLLQAEFRLYAQKAILEHLWRPA